MTATWAFIREHATDDVRLLALQKNRYLDIDIDFALQQILGRQLSQDKLPLWASIEGWRYPVRLPLEQCSSELTALYKKQVLQSVSAHGSLVDLTGGYGVDTFFLSNLFQTAHYVEQNKPLAEIAQSNFLLANKSIEVHNTTAEDFLFSMPQTDVIFIDPARRDTLGKKVYRLADCTPNLIDLFPIVSSRCRYLLVKLSPMIDISQAIKEVGYSPCQVHVVALKGEVKEVLILFDMKSQPEASFKICTANLQLPSDQYFSYSSREESDALPSFFNISNLDLGTFLYEPNAAIMKAGAFRLVAKRFSCSPLDLDAHIYASKEYYPTFPGRIFRLEAVATAKTIGQIFPRGTYANIIVRHFPQSPDEIRKRLHLKDGGPRFLIATSCQGKYVFLACSLV